MSLAWKKWLAALAAAAVGVGVAAGVASAVGSPNDPGYSSVQAAPGGALATMNYAQALNDLGSAPLQDVGVAAVDTGVDLTHPDLAPRLMTLSNSEFVAPWPGDGSNNGGTAPAGSHGWNFLGNWSDGDYTNQYNSPGNADPSDPAGRTGHGTSVTGLMAAAFNNGIGGVGVAPNARILAIRACWDNDNCPGYVLPQAFQFAAQNAVRVISMSWNSDVCNFDGDPAGGACPTPGAAPLAAVKAASSTLFVALAGGNSGSAANPQVIPDSQRPCGNSVSQPNVICVSTSSPGDGIECGGVNGTIVDIAVPTDNNYTTTNGGGFANTGCATSYASPTLAGAAAILFGLDPTASPSDVKSALMDSARPAAAWNGNDVSGGVLDLDASIKLFAQRRGIVLHPGTGGGSGTTTTSGTPATCSIGQTGTSPNCVTPTSAACAAGQTGSPPNCQTPGPASASVSGVGVSGTTATFTLLCQGAAGQSCSGVATLTSHERLRGKRPVGVSARRKSARRTTKVITDASASYNATVGRSIKVTLPLNSTALKVLKRLKRLPATLALNGKPAGTATFKATKKKHKKRKH